MSKHDVIEVERWKVHGFCAQYSKHCMYNNIDTIVSYV